MKSVINILDLEEQIGIESLNVLISEFSCKKNSEIEIFVKENALEFAHRKLSVTYFVFDDDNLEAIFTLAHKALEISTENLSKTVVKQIKKYVQSESSYLTVSAFLIAQFGRNDISYSFENYLNGNDLMEYTFAVLEKIQHEIGGGIVYLECEDNQKLLDFYENEHNHFRKFGERFSNVENKKYIQLLRFF